MASSTAQTSAEASVALASAAFMQSLTHRWTAPSLGGFPARWISVSAPHASQFDFRP